jgi:hypothetical protein
MGGHRMALPVEQAEYGKIFEIEGDRTHLVFMYTSQGLELLHGHTGRAYAGVSLEHDENEHEVCVNLRSTGGCYEVRGALVVDYEYALGMMKDPLLLWRLLKPLMIIEEDDWQAWATYIEQEGRYGLEEYDEEAVEELINGPSVEEIIARLKAEKEEEE